MLNLTAHTLTFQYAPDEDLVVVPPSLVFGKDGIVLNTSPMEEMGWVDGVCVFRAPAYNFKPLDPEVCSSLAPDTVLIVPMIVAKAVLEIGLKEVFGREDLVIMGPASGPLHSERNKAGEIISCRGLIRYN